ncbi:hypothetical protein FRC11_009026 [Ceratobasidium sp. 423]|nr:hypothetical protein FRC11_009026 [Ceratobasidium sp. 423]
MESWFHLLSASTPSSVVLDPLQCYSLINWFLVGVWWMTLPDNWKAHYGRENWVTRGQWLLKAQEWAHMTLQSTEEGEAEGQDADEDMDENKDNKDKGKAVGGDDKDEDKGDKGKDDDDDDDDDEDNNDDNDGDDNGDSASGLPSESESFHLEHTVQMPKYHHV